MRNTFKPALFFVVTLAAIGGIAGTLGPRWLSPSSSPAASSPLPPPLDPSLPGMQLQDANFRLNEGGKPQWQFRASQVQQTQDGRTVSLNGLDQGVYYKDGKPYLRMQAGSATYDSVTRELQMGGGVQVSGPNGLRFDAGSLIWRGDKKLLVCPGPVHLQTADGWITAGGTLTADLKRQTFTLEQVSGGFRLDGMAKRGALKGVPL